MAFPIAWILDKMGQKMYAWSSTKAIMDFDRGGEKGQLLKETLKNLENNSILVYTHSRSGNVNEFTGTGSNGRALMTADVQTGDTFTVNGVPVTAYMGAEDATDSMAGSAWTGKWISFVYDGETLNFKGGGGLSAAEQTLPGQFLFAPYRVSYGEGGVNASRQPWVNHDDDLDKTVYATLYAAVGDSLSLEAAEGMFNCKKLADRFLLTAGPSFAALSQGGEAEHTLTVAEMPSHWHREMYQETGNYYYPYVTGTKGNRNETSISTNVFTEKTGGDEPHNNLPPYIGMCVHVHS